MVTLEDLAYFILILDVTLIASVIILAIKLRQLEKLLEDIKEELKYLMADLR